MLHIIYAEDLLERHFTDPSHSIQRGQRQSGHTHGHKHGGYLHRHAHFLKEPGNAAGEDLERGALGSHAVLGGGTGHAQRQYSQHALQNHGAVANFQHILLIGDGLR